MVESIKQLSDSAHEELQQEVSDSLESLKDEDVLSITSIRARQVGSASVAEVSLEVSSDMTTTATRALEERIQQYLRRELLKGSYGRSVVATVHAKPNLVICPLLNQQVEGKGAALNAGQDSASVRATEAINHSQDHDHSEAESSKDTNDNQNGSASNGLSATENTMTATSLSSSTESTTISASQIESQVRQQALLLYPKTHFVVTGVTVHFSSQNTVAVDCNIQMDESDGSSLQQVQEYASQLQEALESNSQEIESARIFLDLNQQPAKIVTA